jgi:hypothetical protein
MSGSHGSESERTEKERRGLPQGEARGRASEEAETRGAAKESRAGGLRQRGGALSCLCQRLDQQSARGGRGERLWQSRGEALEPGGYRAEERSETASSLPEASGESMAESQREEERLESLRSDRLPWERGERLDQIRERREGGRGRASERRREHESQRAREQRREASSPMPTQQSCCARLDRDNRDKERRSQRRRAVLSQFSTMPVCA